MTLKGSGFSVLFYSFMNCNKVWSCDEVIMWGQVSVFSLLLLAVCGQSLEDPIVTITQGSVSGSLSSDASFYEFYGIPYADSTSGSRRFQAPAPAPSFQDTFEANRKDVKCVRALGAGYEGTEDCLVLDVFTPNVTTDTQYPVMVWVKGREFDPPSEPELSFKNIVDEGIVVVSINYRESILGFLCLGTETAPGNAGLKDIIAGLRWVQDNIAAFGGNPNNVTLFGHGTGAAAVDLVTLSPMSEGLIQKAIAQSGTAISPWAVTRDPTKYAIIVAEALGHTITDIEALSEVFARTSVAALMGVINELDLTDNSLAFAPCVENEYLEGDEKFLVQSPYEIIVSGNFSQIPFIIGYVENEGTIRTDEAIDHDWLEKMDQSFEDFLQADLKFSSSLEQQNIADEIRYYYFGEDEISFENIDRYISYHGDTMILVSAIREARLRAQSSPETYLYQFSYQGQLGQPFASALSVVGAGHSEELGYLFTSDSNVEVTVEDSTVQDIIVQRWTNFAKNGQPTSETSTVEWLPVTSEATNILIFRNNESSDNSDEIDNTIYLDVALVDPHSGIVSFWNEVYNDYYFDAEGVWAPSERDDDDDEEAEVATEEVTIVTEPEEIDETEETEDNENSTDSASTAVAYTFLIVSLFAVLNHVHSSIIGL